MLNGLSPSVKTQVTTDISFHFWTLSSSPLVGLSLCQYHPVLESLLCSKLRNRQTRILLPCHSFLGLHWLSKFLAFHVNFRINLALSTQTNMEFSEHACTLAHSKAKGQVREPASRALAVQPALGVIALGSGEHSGVSTQGIE